MPGRAQTEARDRGRAKRDTRRPGGGTHAQRMARSGELRTQDGWSAEPRGRESEGPKGQEQDQREQERDQQNERQPKRQSEAQTSWKDSWSHDDQLHRSTDRAHRRGGGRALLVSAFE